MNPLPIKKINFLKGGDAPASNNNNHVKKEEKTGFWARQEQHPLFFVLLFVLLISYFIAYIPSKSLPVPQEGEIATADIIAPEDLTIEDKETTESRRQAAEETILPVYSLDPNIFLNSEENIRELFTSGQEFVNTPATAARIEEFQTSIFESYGFEIPDKILRALVQAKFPLTLQENLISLLGIVSEQGIIFTKNLFIHKEPETGLTLIRSVSDEKTISVSDILDIPESREKIQEELDQLDLSSIENELLFSLSNLFLSHNINYNQVETDRRQRQARADVETVFYNIKKGKVIVRKGDEINSEVLKQINIINQNLSDKPSWLMNFFGAFLLFALLMVSLYYYLKSIKKFDSSFKIFFMMGVILIMSLLFYKLSLFLSEILSKSTSLSILTHSESYPYAMPIQFGTMILAFLAGIHIALIFAVINSLLLGYLYHANFYFLVFSLIGALAAIYGIKHYGKKKRSTIFNAGLALVAPVNILILLSFHLIRESIGPFGIFASEIIMAVFGALLSATLAFLFLPSFENLFGFITQSKLLELTNSDLPILRQMAIEAPGTYHHSLIVSSLAEKAADILKIDSMLVKAGALYHDIGKIKRPEYFIENHTRNLDMHKDLKPSMSTLVIINHVKEGVEQAKKLKLPKKIRDIIEQHHGNSLVRYFFEKAKTAYDPEMQKVGEESYRYAGPKPKSKEAALVMLSDSIEAASRSLKSPTKAHLKRLINDIINNYLQDGQMDDCEITIKELKLCAASFLETLYTIYHHRVEYPGFDFEKSEKRKPEGSKKSDDRNNQPPK